MLKENWRFISRIQKLADFAICILAYSLAYYSRNILFSLEQKYQIGLPIEKTLLAPFSEYFLVLLVSLASMFLTLVCLNSYGSQRLKSLWTFLKNSVISSLFVLATIAILLFIFRIQISRSFILLFCTYLAVFLALERIFIFKILHFWRSKGLNYRNIIICGINEQTFKLAEEIISRPELGIKIKAISVIDENHQSIELAENLKTQLAKDSQAFQIIIGKKNVTELIRQAAVDEIIVTDISQDLKAIEDVIYMASLQGIRTTIAADFFNNNLVRTATSNFANIPLIHFQPPPGDKWTLNLKRVVDVLLSAIALVVLSPLLILTALIIKLSSNGAILFRQKRVGRNGHLFDLYKFRSMRDGAEQEQKSLAKNNEMSGPAFKLKNDPRITKVGAFIRKYSIDELPQLWNVLIGEMSLVGPRPPIPSEVNLYERYYRRRLSMRPGLTCTWQVSGRNEISDFKDWVKLDLEYIDNWSFSSDILIILRTIPTILSGKGA